MPQSPHVRPAISRDGPAFLSLVDALADYESLPRPEPEARTRLLRDGFGPQPRFELLLAEDQNRVVGYLAFFMTYSTFLAQPTLFVEDVFVLSDARRLGAGKLLFQTAGKIALARDCGRMEWSVLDWNTSAQEFYNRLGAKRLQEWWPYRMVHTELASLVGNIAS